MHPDHLFAVTVLEDGDLDPEVRERFRRAWDESALGILLEILDNPFRDLTQVVEQFLDRTEAAWSDDTLTVMIPEFVVERWWEHVLHNQSALALKARLLYRRNTVVTSVPWRLD